VFLQWNGEPRGEILHEILPFSFLRKVRWKERLFKRKRFLGVLDAGLADGIPEGSAADKSVLRHS
jgi:hypothetical protein